jgi:hypothetical protein
MAKSHSMPTSTRTFVQYLGSGNGSRPPETKVQRLSHIEESLVRMQSVLETQFRRMADMQVLVDRLTAERNR